MLSITQSFKYNPKSTENRLFSVSSIFCIYIYDLWGKSNIYCKEFDFIYEFCAQRLTAAESPGGSGESYMALNLIIEDRIIFLKEFSQQFSYTAEICHFSSQCWLQTPHVGQNKGTGTCWRLMGR